MRGWRSDALRVDAVRALLVNRAVGRRGDAAGRGLDALAGQDVVVGAVLEDEPCLERQEDQTRDQEEQGGPSDGNVSDDAVLSLVVEVHSADRDDLCQGGLRHARLGDDRRPSPGDDRGCDQAAEVKQGEEAKDALLDPDRLERLGLTSPELDRQAQEEQEERGDATCCHQDCAASDGIASVQDCATERLLDQVALVGVTAWHVRNTGQDEAYNSHCTPGRSLPGAREANGHLRSESPGTETAGHGTKRRREREADQAVDEQVRGVSTIAIHDRRILVGWCPARANSVVAKNREGRVIAGPSASRTREQHNEATYRGQRR